MEAAAGEGITAVGAQREGHKFDAAVCDQWHSAAYVPRPRAQRLPTPKRACTES